METIDNDIINNIIPKEKAKKSTQAPLHEIEFDLQMLDIFNFLPDATFVIDLAGKVLIWNDAIEELTGIKRSSMLGMGNYEYAVPFYNTRRPVLIDLILHPEFNASCNYPLIKRKNDMIYGEFFTPGIGANGLYLWSTAKPLYNRSGNIIGAIESVRDISELKSVNQTISRQKDELLEVNARLSTSVTELERRNKDFETANTQLLEAREELLKSNELLRLSDEKFSKAFKNSPVVVSLSTVSDGRYIDVSDNFYDETGWTRDDVIGHTSHDINIWVCEKERLRVIQTMKEKGCARELEIRFRKRNGEIRTKLFSGDIIEFGGVPYLLSMNSDITDRIIAEEKNRSQKIELENVNRELKDTINDLLRAQQELLDLNKRLLFSEEKFSKTVHLGPVIITLSRLSDGVYIEVSDYFLRLTGYSREEVIGHSAISLNIWADVNERNNVINALKRDNVVRGLDILFCSRNGTVYTMNYSAEIITIADELHLVSVAVDVTERKKAEEEKSRLEHQLQQSQKMETVGRLAGGIAHDFNNLLTAILGNVELCMIRAGKGSELYPKLEMIKKASDSAADLTGRILAFSRKQIIKPEIIDLNEIINHIHKILERVIGEDVRLDTPAKAVNGKILADPGQIEQILLNLSVNARDAMAEGGTLTIGTENVFLDGEYCRTHAYTIPGEYVLLSVTDTGSGMTDEVQKHLFEPFYTTKPKGKGTGLGLSMVYGSVKQNNGSIEVDTGDDKGTSFMIYFPVYSGEYPAPMGIHERELNFEGDKTILLVEDNTMVLEFATDILENAGFRVLEAQNGENAREMEQAYTGKIDLLLTDVIMPGINGKTLAENLLKKRPDIKILLTSGYTEDIVDQRNAKSEGLNFLTKPYSAEALLKKIQSIFDR